MIVIPGRIPIAIHPFFWVLAALIGWLNSQSLIGMLVWIGIIFVSVLIHEFGHALTAVCFKQRANIQLVALGGLTSYEGGKLSFLKQFIIVLNGPLAGMGLFFLSFFLVRSGIQGFWLDVFRIMMIANLFWSVVNLLPVLPLDGGQLLRITLEGFFGLKGFKASLFIGALIAALLSFYFFMIQAFLIGAIFFLFAFQSFDSWRKSRLANSKDRDEDLKKEMIEAEQLLQAGDRSGAIQHFEKILQKAPGGMLATNASQLLAFLYVHRGQREEAYQLLVSVKEHLANDALCLLHTLAAEKGNSELVAQLSAECYQFSPTRDVALCNAKAFARLGQPEPSGGWLQTAWQFGSFNMGELLQDDSFTQVRDDPVFRKFVDPLKE